MEIGKIVLNVDTEDLACRLAENYSEFDFVRPEPLPYLYLCERKAKLAIESTVGDKLFLSIDFSSAELRKRKRLFSPKSEPILRAIGKLAPGELLVDGTAGTGRESYLLASAGYEIQAYEHSPYLYTLLHSALQDLYGQLDLSQAQKRLQFLHGDCVEKLKNSSSLEKVRVLYLDPMFPSSGKSAKVKKSMQILQLMELQSKSPEDLFEEARDLQIERLVCKRPKDASFLDRAHCREYYENKSIRFEVY